MTRSKNSDARATAKVALVAIAPLIGVSEACRLLDFSRDTAYRLSKTYRNGGFRGLVEAIEQSARHPTRVSQAIERDVLAIAEREPTLGKSKVAARLREAGHSISPTGVAAVWQRHQLTTVARRLEYARASTVGHGAESQVLLELKRIGAELARVRQSVEREPRRSPNPSKRSLPAVRPASAVAPATFVRELFGLPSRSDTTDVPVAPEPDAPSTSGHRSSLLARFFGPSVDGDAAHGDKRQDERG